MRSLLSIDGTPYNQNDQILTSVSSATTTISSFDNTSTQNAVLISDITITSHNKRSIENRMLKEADEKAITYNHKTYYKKISVVRTASKVTPLTEQEFKQKYPQLAKTVTNPKKLKLFLSELGTVKVRTVTVVSLIAQPNSREQRLKALRQLDAANNKTVLSIKRNKGVEVNNISTSEISIRSSRQTESRTKWVGETPNQSPVGPERY